MDGVLKKMQGFDFTKFKEELGKRGFKVREARASTGNLTATMSQPEAVRSIRQAR